MVDIETEVNQVLRYCPLLECELEKLHEQSAFEDVVYAICPWEMADTG